MEYYNPSGGTTVRKTTISNVEPEDEDTGYGGGSWLIGFLFFVVVIVIVVWLVNRNGNNDRKGWTTEMISASSGTSTVTNKTNYVVNGSSSLTSVGFGGGPIGGVFSVHNAGTSAVTIGYAGNVVGVVPSTAAVQIIIIDSETAQVNAGVFGGVNISQLS